MAKRGKYTSHNIKLHEHEEKTILFLLQRGYSVELIAPTGISRTPDIILDGARWEMKAPEGDTKWTISRNLNKGRGQSNKIIVDLRRCKRTDEKCLREIQNYFSASRSISEILVITKKQRAVVYKKS